MRMNQGREKRKKRETRESDTNNRNDVCARAFTNVTRAHVKRGRKIKPTNVIINPNALLRMKRSHKFSINSDNRATLIADEITAS